MYLAPYLPGGIVFAFTIDSVTCYYIVVVKLEYFKYYLNSFIKSLNRTLARPIGKRLPASDQVYP